MKKTAVVEFDGVIHRYSKGWYDGTIYDPPNESGRAILEHLRKKNYDVVIYSVRASNRTINWDFQNGQLHAMKVWLENHNLPYTKIWTDPGKPMGVIYVDCRGYRFDPNQHPEDAVKGLQIFL